MEGLRDIGPIVSWLLVIAGWWVVSRDHNKRERRKEVRGQVDQLIRLTLEIEGKAFSYLPTAAESPEGLALGMQLKSSLNRLAVALARLSKSEKMDLSECMTKLRQAVTSRDFDSCARQPCNLDSQWALEISDAANALVDRLEAQFRHLHP